MKTPCAVTILAVALLFFSGCRSVTPNLSSDDPDERRLGLLELRDRRDAAAVRKMVETLADGDDLVRKTAVDLLAGLNDGEVLQHLIPLFGDGSDIVRSSACRAVGNLGKDDVVPDLISFLKKERSPMVRREAVVALSRFAANPAALETVIETVDDGEPVVAQAAQASLLAIAGDPADAAGHERSVEMWRKWFADHPVRR